MNLENLDIRTIVADRGLLYQDIAAEMKIAPESLSRLMRCKLTRKSRQRILTAIDELSEIER